MDHLVCLVAKVLLVLLDLRDPEVQLDPTANPDNLDPWAQQEGKAAQVRQDLRAQDCLVLPALAVLLDPPAQRVQLDLLVHLALQATPGHKATQEIRDLRGLWGLGDLLDLLEDRVQQDRWAR